MSMLNRQVNGTDLGEVVASTREYEAAQKTVSKLIAGEVPARDIAIVGEGVRTVERVTGKLGYATAARSGATNGVLIGLVLSAIMLFGNPEAPISLFLGFLLVGVALGMIMSLISYAIVRRRRDFASVSQMLADHYEVRVQAASLAKARSVIGADRPTSTRPAVDLSQPPRYGERITPGGQAGSASGSAPAAAPHTNAPHANAPHTPAAPPPPPPLPAAAPEAPAVAGTGAAPDTTGAEPDAGVAAAPDAGAGAASDAGVAAGSDAASVDGAVASGDGAVAGDDAASGDSADGGQESSSR